jgi:hypothetical protein
MEADLRAASGFFDVETKTTPADASGRLKKRGNMPVPETPETKPEALASSAKKSANLRHRGD